MQAPDVVLAREPRRGRPETGVPEDAARQAVQLGGTAGLPRLVDPAQGPGVDPLGGLEHRFLAAGAADQQQARHAVGGPVEVAVAQ